MRIEWLALAALLAAPITGAVTIACDPATGRVGSFVFGHHPRSRAAR